MDSTHDIIASPFAVLNYYTFYTRIEREEIYDYYDISKTCLQCHALKAIYNPHLTAINGMKIRKNMVEIWCISYVPFISINQLFRLRCCKWENISTMRKLLFPRSFDGNGQMCVS